MNAAPRVSVIMGAYNCERTLDASIESILAQDFGDLELVVCDDGSTDGTLARLEAHAARDSRVIILRSERNGGLSKALNRCVAASRGEYLARMDADDIALPERLSRQVAFLDGRPEVGWCGCGIDFFDDGGVWGKLQYPESPVAKDYLLRSPFAHPTVVFRAELLRSAGIYEEDPRIGRSEDYDLFMRLYAMGHRGYNLPDRLFLYREERGSLKRRKFRYALTEARVRYRGFSRLGLLPLGLPYVLKPVLIGLIPKSAYALMRKAYLR